MNTLNIKNTESHNPSSEESDASKQRDELIKEMFNKYLEYKTLEKVAEDYGYTRERVRQYFVIGNRKGIIDYKPFNRENFKKIKTELPKDKLVELFKEYGTVRDIAERTSVSISHINRLVKIYGLDINTLRKDHLKNKILNEYLDLVKKSGNKNISTYDLLSIPNGRNIWARIARTWGTFKQFREENNIVLPAKSRRRKK